MTIAIAIRTQSAVVFAADSKLTTSGIAGFQEDGSPLWLEQTYDNATKVVSDRTKTYMAMMAGHANIGQTSVTDLFTVQQLPLDDSKQLQDERVNNLVNSMVTKKREYWGSVPDVQPEKWPGPTLLIAAPHAGEDVPRVWRVELSGPESVTEEILTEPGIRLEGAYDEVFTLLYGWDHKFLTEFNKQLCIAKEQFIDALKKVRVLRTMDKLNLWAIPIQDAIDLAVFLATVQVQMDRFLPGTPACGGPIDVMVLQMAPEPGIVAYPGKSVRHPGSPW